MASSRLLMKSWKGGGILEKLSSFEGVCNRKACYNLLQKRDCTRTRLRKVYEDTKAMCQSKKLPPDVNPEAVFACNELDLREVEVYGFDYDYTLACYKESVDFLIYNLGKKALINNFKYPKAIADLEYKPGFAVRGLHYDIENGLLMKIDTFLQIQLGSVYRGLTRVSDEEVLRIYKHRYIPVDHFDDGVKSRVKMAQLADLFSLPEMGLLCNVAEYFSQHNIDCHPEILFRDVKASVQSIHPVMHKVVEKDVAKYLEENTSLRKFLNVLLEGGKKIFLVTNSPFSFVDNGMRYLIGPDWRDIFDLVVAQARKPKFFTDVTTPFRIYDPETNVRLWDRVTSLQKGKIYCEGTLKQLQDFTGWSGQKVLYFGDHPYSDLADVTLHHGWRTGAIIRELAIEINKLNNDSFKWSLNWMTFLTQLMEDHQELGLVDEGAREIIGDWKKEVNELRNLTKSIFNKQFGSVFRTHHNPTFFSRRLFRFADIYTSNLTNLLNYSSQHVFYPRRGALPHEYRSWFV